MTTTINVVGTIATDPKLVEPNVGTPLCSFRVASDERRYDREQQSWVEGHTNWFGVVCFRGLASHARASFKKGDRVIIHGRLRVRTWEKEGKRGTSVEIEAEAIGHDIRWGVSHFEKKTGAASTASQAVGADGTMHEQVRANAEGEQRGEDPGEVAPLRTSNGEPSADAFVPDLARAA